MQPAQAPDVSILIVSFNTSAMTQAAIDSVVRETTDFSFEIITVDNASTDGSADMLSRHPAVSEFVKLDDNIGFARANNLAATRARGRYILLLNPDTIVRDGAIDRLADFAGRRPQARIWGGRTLFADGSLNPSSCWGRMTPWNQLCRALGLTGLFPRSAVMNGEAYGGWMRDSVREVDIVSGCFLLIERSLWEELGGFDARFFMYGEEADLCLRARAYGARPVVTPGATIVHYGGASETTRAGKMVRLLAAKATLIERHWHPMMRSLGKTLLAAWPLSRAIATAAANLLLSENDGRAQSAEAWRQIWQRRNEWRHGYASGAARDDHWHGVPVAAEGVQAP